MRKSLANFFLTCALILVLGHAILPHSHLERAACACEVTEVQDLSMADIIKLALAQNIGTNHLEEFNNCKKHQMLSGNYFDPIFISILLNDLLLIFPLIQRIISSVNQIIMTGFTGAYSSLRAPPALS